MACNVAASCVVRCGVSFYRVPERVCCPSRSLQLDEDFLFLTKATAGVGLSCQWPMPLGHVPTPLAISKTNMFALRCFSDRHSRTVYCRSQPFAMIGLQPLNRCNPCFWDGLFGARVDFVSLVKGITIQVGVCKHRSITDSRNSFLVDTPP